jgi:hypothetical protein
MISVEEFVERICLLGADRGPRRFPRKRRDRQILTKSILMRLDSARLYGEGDVNEMLLHWKRAIAPAIETDHVTIRRLLVDCGHLERSPDGAVYRVGFPPAAAAFDLEVDEIDLEATIAAYLDHQERRKRERARARHDD